jgi:hypothetical protein
MITDKINADEELLCTLNYVTEFMRQVIENGSGFTNNHFFIFLLHLEVKQLTPTFFGYLKIIIKEMRL